MITRSATKPARHLILASTSSYRRALLEQLSIAFDCVSPDCDESALPAEPITAQVERLASNKARSVRNNYPDSLIIGSDQLADLDGQALGKPMTEARAIEQLQRCSGRTVVFRTGLCLLDARTGHEQTTRVDATLIYRQLTLAEIRRYVRLEQPWYSAGSIHVEGLGPALLESLQCEDPSAVIGLPLISLCSMLRKQGVEVP